MARRGHIPKRRIEPDHKFNNVVVAKFANLLMQSGKKSIALKIIYDAFDIISEKTKQEPIEVFDSALKNVGPSLEIKARRIGGANYQVPHEVHGERRNALAMRWIIEASRNKKGKRMAEKLATELMDASEKQGAAFKKREDVQRMADANKAFAHFAR